MRILIGALVGFFIGAYAPYSNRRHGVGSSYRPNNEPPDVTITIAVGFVGALLGVLIAAALG